MLNRVHERRPTYNNDANISNSALKTAVKVVYYRIFAVFYAIMGRFVDVCMCNSAWTRGHLRALWGGARELHVVAPPCNTEALQALPAVERKPWVLSVGQFRPEKDHRLQLRAFKALTELGVCCCHEWRATVVVRLCLLLTTFTHAVVCAPGGWALCRRVQGRTAGAVGRVPQR